MTFAANPSGISGENYLTVSLKVNFIEWMCLKLKTSTCLSHLTLVEPLR